MNKKIILGLGVSTVAVVAMSFVSFAGAQGSQNYQMRGTESSSKGLETKAQIIGVSTDELREELQTKTMIEVAEEKGVTLEEMQSQMRIKAMERWKEKGLSDEEIQQRIDFQEQKQANHDSAGANQGQGGFRGGR